MEKWKEWMADLDDDYLIGLSNKGIVKRAYKDKEENTAEIVTFGEEVEVKVGMETVRICYPLGESKCSCPSRSICRHIVLAILVLREYVKEQETEKPIDISALEGDVVCQEAESVKKIGTEQLLEEIRNYPLDSLKKSMGVRQFQDFVSKVKRGICPEIHYTSMITVKLPWHSSTVKLIFPLAYSSCSCHKKEFCVHKAEAVLWCQLDLDIVTKEKLTEEAEKSMEYSLDQIHETAVQMKQFLDELFGTGLSRTSPDVLDYLERLAIISHNANLPKYEGYFRALFDSYGRYFKRLASFRPHDLMVQMTKLYRRVELLLQTKSNTEVAEYAGEFKAEYISVGNLDLIGVAMEHFFSQTGYEGETIYFLEEHTKEWYTYTVARPVFYEKGNRFQRQEKGQAPWGMMLSLEELSKKRISLLKVRCDERNRLSSSQETKGTIIGERNLTWKELERWHYQDFQKLFLERIGKEKGQWLKGKTEFSKKSDLVLLQAAFCEKAVFSETDQRLSMVLFDKAGREVVVEVVYSKKEERGIFCLEQIREDELPYFLGKVYLRDGRIRMYPVALIDRKEILDE